MTSSESIAAELEFESKMESEKKKQIVLEHPQPKVVDDHEFFASFSNEKGKHLMEFQQKYNFDFVNEVPLSEGRYEWYPVDSNQANSDHGSESSVTKIT